MHFFTQKMQLKVVRGFFLNYLNNKTLSLVIHAGRWRQWNKKYITRISVLCIFYNVLHLYNSSKSVKKPLYYFYLHLFFKQIVN